jgi:hypothetical protein
MYAHWATISLEEPNLVVVPFTLLPSERLKTTVDTTEDRVMIRNLILERTLEEMQCDPHLQQLLDNLGPDLAINAFACNFRVNGHLNEDIAEANILNGRIHERLSFSKLSDRAEDFRLILMLTTYSQTKYGDCLTNFKRRLGLQGNADLRVFVNVTMSPFSCHRNFDRVLAGGFKSIALEELAVCCALRPQLFT